MGCRCGQNKQAPTGAATYAAPPRQVGTTVYGQGTPDAGVWYVVTTEDGTTTFESLEAAAAFASGEYPITRTSHPPQPVA